MRKLLPILALTACTKVSSNLEHTDEARCDAEIQAVIDACEASNVIGDNENGELDKAVLDAKECFGGKVRILCSDTDMTKIVQFHRL